MIVITKAKPKIIIIIIIIMKKKEKKGAGNKKREGVFVVQFDGANSGLGAIFTLVGLSAEDHVHRGENPSFTPSG